MRRLGLGVLVGVLLVSAALGVRAWADHGPTPLEGTWRPVWALPSQSSLTGTTTSRPVQISFHGNRWKAWLGCIEAEDSFSLDEHGTFDEGDAAFPAIGCSGRHIYFDSLLRSGEHVDISGDTAAFFDAGRPVLELRRVG